MGALFARTKSLAALTLFVRACLGRRREERELEELVWSDKKWYGVAQALSVGGILRHRYTVYCICIIAFK